MAPPERRPRVGPKRARPVPRRDSFDFEDAREKAKAVGNKGAREKFEEVIDMAERQKTDLADARGRLNRRIERVEELEAKLAEKELRRVLIGGPDGEAILLPLSTRDGDLLWLPDGRVYKVGGGGTTLVLVGDPR